MPKYKLSAGSTVDILNKEELADQLDVYTRNWYQEKARGMTTAGFETVGTISAGTISLPSNLEKPIGPHPGFAWALQRVSVQGIAGSDSIKIYKNAVNDIRFLAQMTAGAPTYSPGASDIILRGGDHLLFTGASLSLMGDVSINGEAIEVPELDLYKLL
jgi:hypothetical protein